MSELFIFILGIVLGGFIGFFIFKNKKEIKIDSEKKEEGDGGEKEAADAEGSGEPRKGVEKLEEFNAEREEKKQENKNKILIFLRENQEIRNNDIERLLSVSDATATRYAQELEDEGKVVQIGENEKSYYKLRNN